MRISINHGSGGSAEINPAPTTPAVVATGELLGLPVGRPVYFTDGTAGGSSRNADGAYGWVGGYMMTGSLLKASHGRSTYVSKGTIGRMEALAVKDVLDTHYGLCLHGVTSEFKPLIVSDSEYMVKTLEPGGYIERWEMNSYTKANGDPVQNPDVMKHLSRLRKLCPFEIVHIHGHLSSWNSNEVRLVMRRLGVVDHVARDFIHFNNQVDRLVTDTRGQCASQAAADYLVGRAV